MNTLLPNTHLGEVSPVRGRLMRTKWPHSLLTFLLVSGPGLIVREADNDAGSVTYVPAGAQRVMDEWKQPKQYLVVHPCDDLPEQKVEAALRGPTPLTGSVGFSLLALRTNLVLMMLLVLYRVADLADGF
jgi:hypothetical protein